MPSNTYGRQVVLILTNKSGGSVAAGDVVVFDTTTDESFTTTTTGRAELSVGIAQETIASNALGRVLVSGYAALVNVPASVTRGHYVETHTVVKQATGNSTRRSGSFGQFAKTSATPSAWLWGQTDQTTTGSGALVFLAAQTASASATLDFSTFISSTYDTYIFKFVNVLPATSTAILWMRMGTGAGPTYDAGASYGSQLFRHSFNASAISGADSGANQIPLTTAWLSTGAHAIGGHLELYDPQGSLNKFVSGKFIYPDSTLSNMAVSEVGGQYNSATAVTAVRFLMSSGNITSGVIRVYGVTKS